MENLFSPDSLFMRIMSRVADLLLLNLLFLLTSIPLITIGASATAMYTVCFRFETERESGVVGSYFRAFRDNWKQATAIWLILVFCFGCACFNGLLFFRMSGLVRYIFPLFLILAVLVLLTGGYVFPLLSQFDNPTASTLKNALALSLGYLPRSVLITALNVFPFILFLTNPYYFFHTAFIWAAIYFSAAACLNCLLLKKVLQPYLYERRD